MRKRMPITDILPARKGPKYGGIPVSETPAPIPADDVRFVMQYGGRCRDCGDCNGFCQDEGLPCDPVHRERIIRHVLTAIEYGRANGFLADRAAQAKRVREDEAVTHQMLAEGWACLKRAGLPRLGPGQGLKEAYLAMRRARLREADR